MTLDNVLGGNPHGLIQDLLANVDIVVNQLLHTLGNVLTPVVQLVDTLYVDVFSRSGAVLIILSSLGGLGGLLERLGFTLTPGALGLNN
jgi:hypothetical protein